MWWCQKQTVLGNSYLIRSWLAKSMSSKVFQEVNSIVYFTAGNIKKPLSLWVGVHGDEEEEKIVDTVKFFRRVQLSVEGRKGEVGICSCKTELGPY